MAEVMAKSKEYKVGLLPYSTILIALNPIQFQRQAQKQQDDDTRHQLDQEFSSIRDLLFATPVDPSSSGSNSIPLGRSKPAPQPTSADEETVSAPPAETVDEDYDQFVRQLAFEKRAKPKDRLKTEEEIALEEKEKLETAEKARQRRMRGEEDGGSGDETTTRRGRRRRPQADDLEDDFMDEQDEEIGGLGKGLSQASEIGASGSGLGLEEGSEEGSEDEESAEESGEEGEEQGLEASFASSYGEDQLSGQEGEGEELVVRRTTPSKNGKGKAKELPFTFKCPASHDEFLELLQDVNEDQVPTVIERIRVLHHPSLAVGNNTKLQVSTSSLETPLLF